MMMVKLDFTDEPAAQDMIKIIMRDENLTAADAINFAVSKTALLDIFDTDWVGIAYKEWGHAELKRQFMKLDNPILEIDLSKDKKRMISVVRRLNRLKTEGAIAYFLTMTMRSIGYHI